MNPQKNCLVLMFPENQKDAHVLQREVLKNYQCNVETVITAPALLQRLSQGDVNGLFCSLKNFDLPFLNVIGKAQGLCRDMFTVVISETAEKRALEYLKRLDKIVHLEKPMPLTAIAIICDKILQGTVVFERKHKRFPTNQPAELEIPHRRQKLRGHVYNMSKGGAYMELDEGEVVVKEAVKLILPLDQLGKERTVHAKVAWVLKNGFHHHRFAVGLEFTQSSEAYLSVFDRG